MQSTHNVAADNKALGLSSLQEAESVLVVIEELQLTKPAESNTRVTDHEIKARTTIQRADVSPDVSEGGSD